MTRTVSSMTDFEKNAITIQKKKGSPKRAFLVIIELR